MPSPSLSPHSLSPGLSLSRSVSQLGAQRARAQLLLALGVVQMGLGSMIVTVSFVAVAFTSSPKVRHACPFWAGFFVVVSGLVGVISWRRPLTLVVSLFMLLSAVCVILSLAGSILSCQNAQFVKSMEKCNMDLQPASAGRLCVCGIGDTLKLYHYKDCFTVRMALKDLLFSACGLSILSTIICSLSTVICCIHIFSLDLLHMMVPHRSRSVNPECTTPQDAFLTNMMDFEEFVPPVPPPPYYPPEYTCSSETDAQSITYNGSMESPAPLYPTDCPPPYEAVMGQRAGSQATVFDAYVSELSCERITSTVFSGEVSMDSGSLLMSEIMDIPDDSSPSEDSCLLGVGAGVGGSLRSMDCSVYRLEPQPSPSLARRCYRGERSSSCSSTPPPPPPFSTQSASSCTRLEQLGGAGGGVPEIRVRPCTPSHRISEGSSLGSQGSQQQQQRRHSDQSRPPTPPRGLTPHPLMRSHSDPGLSSSSDTGHFSGSGGSKGLTDEASQTSTDSAPCSEACLLPRSLLAPPSPVSRKCSGKGRKPSSLKPLPPAAQLHLSKAGTRSLGDLKVTRGLVSRFLQRSKRNLTAGAEHAGNKRRHEGTNPVEQVLRSSRLATRGCRQEGIHLQSCGDLSSSSSSLRRLLSPGRSEHSRPQSVSGLYKESAL
ncbi:protein FAM189B [Acipenser oxyrinchus oxyrinchus]|uniref:Protein FAM189B n=1 Tax=Acipenser oxyrinchus oxyrinchus TaxID=40147 RepID=A0AAD8CJL4_ACIOX|nr:protein FAM189B [Acipenser oxyrinchus oxyrinchus]